ncbi:MFS general substrate transporter [Xylaria bambusicola]|uniref:MFS general substrate transporter n=1 Tax=Xylaria bambusicola TaxID=326684 RepID=UPI002007A5F5|nr:MFS general substrate transporter [Xylaria bambusicola]KAI0520688.1 MFS general substrate transporter [Xylaria bambusicola]
MTTPTANEATASAVGNSNIPTGGETTTLPFSLQYPRALGNTSAPEIRALPRPGVKQVVEGDDKEAYMEKSELVEEISPVDGGESHYPPSWKVALLTIGINFALFLVALDGSILATAIPAITKEFNSFNDVAWYGSSYLFAVSALQLLYGKLYTMYSVKWVFLVAVFVLEIGSLVAGAAPSSNAIIVGRTISGVGAAGVYVGCILIVANTVSLQQRPIYVGILASVHGLASVVGPILGGAFSDHVTWRWCFYINLPVGAVTLLFIFLFLPHLTPTPSRSCLPWKQQIKQLDLPGLFFLIPCIISLLFALQWGGSKYPWGSARIIALFVVFGVLGVIFWCVELWQKDLATVPPRILRNKNILGGIWYGVWLGAAVFVFTYYLPIWFQAIKGTSATDSGVRTLPSILGQVIFALVGGVLASALGQFVPLLIVSSILSAVGAGLLSTLKVNSTIGHWLGYQVIMAIGVGIGSQNVNLIGQVAVPLEDMAIATSILSFTGTLSSSIFLAVAQSVFQNQLIHHLAKKAPEVDAISLFAQGPSALRTSVTPQQLPATLAAYNEAIVQTFYIGVAAAALSITGPAFMDWLSLKQPLQQKSTLGTSEPSIDNEESI